MSWPVKGKDRLSKITKTKVIRCETEFELLEQFLEIFQRTDPDIIVGYDCGFQFDVLMSKIFALKVKNWSCVGKLRRQNPPYFKVCFCFLCITFRLLYQWFIANFSCTGQNEFEPDFLRKTNLRHHHVC